MLLSGQPPYEKDIYLFLSTFRFFSFALAVSLIYTIPKQPLTNLWMLLTVSLIGIYTILKIILRFRLWQRDFVTYMILGGDLAICLALVLLTGGAASPFLLYSLLPVITAALFFEPRIALAIAALLSLGIILAHTVLTTISPSFIPILQGNYLSIVLAYSTFSFLIATITYRTNLNIYRHIQSEATVEERRRLRREIHDNIAQVMGYLNTKVNLLRKSLPPSDEKLIAELDDIYKITSESYEDIREAIDSLDTRAEPVSLIASLSSHIEQIDKRMGSKTELVLPEKPLALHPTAQLQLLYIVKEGLNNVRKHASATQIWVRLENTSEGVELVIKDNGCGFYPSERKGSGLKIMEERATSINGTLAVTSSLGQGTEVKIKVPRR